MMKALPNISKYSYLWDSEFPNWVLESMSVDGRPVFLIINNVTKEVLLVSNSALKQALCEKMLKHGCTVIEG
jgi:hypothetical protein